MDILVKLSVNLLMYLLSVNFDPDCTQMSQVASCTVEFVTKLLGNFLSPTIA